MKRLVAALVGGILTLGGLALLVLPGPGFVLIAAGLAVLATQFDWARKPLDYAKGKAEQGIQEVARSWWRVALVVLCALALAGIGVTEFTSINLPYVTGLTAAMLILSGLGLLATLVYAEIVAHRPKVAATADSEPPTTSAR